MVIQSNKILLKGRTKLKKKRLLMLFGSVCLTLVLAALLLPACAAPPEEEAAAEVITWRLQCAFPPGDISHDQLSSFADSVREKTEGRLSIDIFPGGAIVPIEEMMFALGKGTFEMYHTAEGYHEGIRPVFAVVEGLPGQWPGLGYLDDVNTLLYDRGLMDIFQEAFSLHNIYYLGCDSYGAFPYIVSTVPVRSYEDFEGLKLRLGGPWLDFYARVGAATVWIPGGDIYMALKLGTVDAAAWSSDIVIGLKTYEVIDYVIMPPLNAHLFSGLCVNLEEWEAMPVDIQQALKAAQQEYGQTVFELYNADWEIVEARADELGYEIIWLSDADMERTRQLALPMWDEYADRCDYSARALAIIKDWWGF